jgi:hypothetical protein
MKKCTLLCILLSVFVDFSCKKKNDPFPYAEFTANGTHKKYEQVSGFSKSFCASSTYCGHFYLSHSDKDFLKIGIPGDPIPGHTYKNGDYRFEVYYLNDNGLRYDLTIAPLTLTFSKWEGAGGWAEGTFSGWLKSSQGDSLQLQNGNFVNTID